MAENDSYMNMDIADAIIERPQPFEVDGVRYFLYPPSLGKTMLQERRVKALGFDMEEVKAEPFKAALRACMEHRETVASIISLNTCRTKEEVFDSSLVDERTTKLAAQDPEELATLLVIIMTRYGTTPFIQYLGLDKEAIDRDRVRKCKETKGSYVFGGKSLYGTVIDYACERYGWTMDYVVWGISYQNLQMLMADAIQSIYLTEEEQKHCHVHANAAGEEKINGDDPNSVARLAELLNG